MDLDSWDQAAAVSEDLKWEALQAAMGAFEATLGEAGVDLDFPAQCQLMDQLLRELISSGSQDVPLLH